MKNSLLLLLCVFSLVLQSCKEENPPVSTLEISADQLVQNFTNAANSKTVSVNSNVEFKALSSATEWCTTQIIGGSIKITVTENTEPKERKAKIVVSATGVTSVTIDVVQIGTDPVILVRDAQQGIVVEGDNAEFMLEISTNIAIAFELPEWITKKETRSVTTQNYTFVAGVMPSDLAERTFVMKVKPSGEDVSLSPVTIEVVQKQIKVEYPRFIIMSDNHFDRMSAGTDAVIRAKKVFSTLLSKTPVADAIFVVGDYTDTGAESQYVSMMSVLKDKTYLPDGIPLYPMMGNHDYYTGTSLESQNRFKSYFGLNSIHHYVDVKGYPFLTISVDQKSAPWYTQSTKDFVSASLADAAAKYPGKPIFVFSHIPVSNTTVASNQGTDELESIFNKYPQIIFFTAHTHHSIADPRSINQKNFTAINDGAAWYSEVEGGMVGGIEPPGHDLFLEGMIATVKENGDVSVERWDLFRNEEILPKFEVRAPHDGTAFSYKNLTGGTVPVFEASEKPTVNTITESGCKVEWRRATDDDKVYSYLVEAVNATTNSVVKSFKIFSFFIWNSDTPTTLTADIVGLELKKEYFVRITALDAYGQRSQPIVSANFKTKEYEPDPSVKAPVADLFDVVFNPTGAIDRSVLKHTLEPGTQASQGVPIISFSSSQNNYVGTFNSAGKTNYKIWYKDNKTMKDAFMNSFTIEVYYKALRTGQSPVGAQQQGACGIEHNGNTPVLWAWIGGGYKQQPAATAMNTTDFYHVVFTYDKKVGKLACFINGKPEGETTVTGDFGFPTNSQAHWIAIGGDCNVYPTLDYAFDGEISFARMYSKAVNMDEAFLLHKQISVRSTLLKLNQVDVIINAIIAKIPTISGAEKTTLESLRDEGFELMGDYTTTQADVDQYISKTAGVI